MITEQGIVIKQKHCSFQSLWTKWTVKLKYGWFAALAHKSVVAAKYCILHVLINNAKTLHFASVNSLEISTSSNYFHDGNLYFGSNIHNISLNLLLPTTAVLI